MVVSLLMTLVLLLLTCNQSTDSTHIINAFEKPFKIYWNVPTFQCRSKHVYFEELNAKYGIITNANDSFKGDKMVIMYDPGDFPAILTDPGSGIIALRNGGVPQEGNLTYHLETFRLMVDIDFPNKYYNGLAVIDFESWRPIYRQNWGTLQPYKDLSVDIERELHPTWPMKQILAEAEKRFETEGRKYVEETLKLGKLLRPRATWGYYAYPYCYNMQLGTFIPDCSDEVMLENDRLDWLFDASQSLHPSVYFPESLTLEQRKMLMEGRVYESVRIQGQFTEKKKIYPYFWFVYRDTKNFVAEEDILNALNLFRTYGADGMIVWGSSNDVNTREKCEMLYNYVDLVFGPALLKARRFG